MKPQQSKTWYVIRRGELLAEEFLVELGIASVSLKQADVGFDYIGIVAERRTSLFVFGIEVKATENADRFTFLTSRLIQLCNSNIPILLLVADVKHSELYFAWAIEAIPAERRANLSQTETCSIKLRRSTPEELQRLKSEIENFRHGYSR